MSLPGRTRLRLIGACFALLGFGSQYPIPALHRCPVLNPASYAEEVAGASSARNQAEQAALLAALPSCHRAHLAGDHAHSHSASDAAQARAHAHTHAAPHSEEEDAQPAASADAAHSHEGGGHNHEGCPVCQGFLTLVVGLPEHRVELLSIELLVAARLIETPTAPAISLDQRSPGARAPPLA